MDRRSFLKTLGVAGAAALGSASIASAVVGRPLTPGSVAGVRRRTRRRVRRRVAIGMTIPVLPTGCVYRVAGGVRYHYCGGVWYSPVYQGTNVVYVVKDIDPGTVAYVEVEE